MSRVGITGASGFVGLNLVPYIYKSNYDVKKLERHLFSTSLIETFDCDVIVHLAGKAHDVKKTSNSDEYYQVNYELTKKLYDAFLKSEATKFIFVSSVKAAADIVDGVLTEETIPNPQTDYGKSKLMAEEYIQRQPLPQGKFYYILRPCMIHGPGNKGNLNLLYQFVRRGVPYPLSAFKNERSFLSVENLCFVIKNLIEKEVASGIYQVSDDGTLSTNQVVSVLGQTLNKKVRFWRVPSHLVRFVARIGDIVKLPLNTERLNKLTENYVVSNFKIKNAIQAEFPLSCKDGLKITAASFQSK